MKVSVVIPYHNVEQRLFVLCMQSVLSQIFQDFEVIIVNDGSDDEYLTALGEAIKSDRRVRVIDQVCSGAAAARNRGIVEAKGDYISFIDADDMVMPTYLEDAVQVLEKKSADFVIGGVRTVLQTQDMLSIVKNEERKITGEEVRVFEKAEIGRLKNQLASSRKLINYQEGKIDRGPVARLVRRELAVACQFRRDLVLWEDLIWNIELLDRCQKACTVMKTWYLYYQNPESLVHRYRPDVINEVEKTMGYMKTLLDIKSEDGFESYGDHICDNLRRVCRLFLFRSECPLTGEQRKREFKRIYTSEPWTAFGSDRYYTVASGENKLLSFLYRKRWFFMVFGIKEKILKIKRKFV